MKHQQECRQVTYTLSAPLISPQTFYHFSMLVPWLLLSPTARTCAFLNQRASLKPFNPTWPEAADSPLVPEDFNPFESSL